MTSDILDRRFKPSIDAVESSVGDETVILQLASGVYYGLDPVGTRIWGMLKQRMTPMEICRQIATLLAAGHETSASALTWALYALARAPEALARLCAAVRVAAAEAEADELVLVGGRSV